MRTGVIRLFRFAGIDVYLHFTWFLVAAIFMTDYMRRYQSPIWGVLEYISLFVIVLIHEFGHALACRQVGGVANRIVLWPLGGVAFVNPPRRPGAYLWSIAAGPLVNVALIPILAAAGNLVSQSENSLAPTDAYRHPSNLTTGEGVPKLMNEHNDKQRDVLQHAPDRRLVAAHVIGHEDRRHQEPGEMQVDVDAGEAEKTNYAGSHRSYFAEIVSVANRLKRYVALRSFRRD